MPKPYVPNDKWSQKAAAEGYRARSVYKLMELDARFRLLQPGMKIVDLGAAPGSWMQYAAEQIGAGGKIVGFDLQEIKPLEGLEGIVSIHQADITDHALVDTILQREGITEADLILSDIAPNTSGVKDVDQWRSIELGQAVVDVAKKYLKRGGKCVLKIFRGADFDDFLVRLKLEWKDVRMRTVEASRDRSREVYLVMTKS